tara:strand:- start:261 stop:395 length:135 start_codon:yes stop_codon:yes gene_type:complete
MEDVETSPHMVALVEVLWEVVAVEAEQDPVVGLVAEAEAVVPLV